MRLRIRIGKWLVKAGAFLQTAPLFFLKPHDLISCSRVYYSRTLSQTSWAKDEFVDTGLFKGEKELFELLPRNNGRLLLLGLGGGREAVSLARAGFRVTGVDFVEGMVEKSILNARRRQVEIQGFAQDINCLHFEPSSFDVVWYSFLIYSSIPGRKARIENLRRVGELLAPEGHVVCQFFWNPGQELGRTTWALGKGLAWLTLGNRRCEKSDVLRPHLEFLHAFSRNEEIRAEFDEAGFEILKLVFPEDSHNAGALLKKRKTPYRET